MAYMVSAIEGTGINRFCRSKQKLPYKGLQISSPDLESSPLLASCELDGEKHFLYLDRRAKQEKRTFVLQASSTNTSHKSLKLI